MPLSAENAALRSRSGETNSTDPLVSFVYHLLRDHLPAGSIEGILQNHVLGERSDAEFCNGYLADYAKDVAKRLEPKEKPKPRPKMSRAEATSTIGKIILTQEGLTKVACALSGAVRHRLTREGKDPGRLVILNEGRPGEPLALHACSTGVDELSYHFSQMEFETTEDFLDRVKTEIVGLYPEPAQATDDDEPEQDNDVHSEEPEPSHLETLQMKVQNLNAKIPAGAQKWMVTDVTNHDPRDKGEATYFILWALHQGKNECKAELMEKGPWTHIQITLDGLANGEPEPFSTEYHNRRTQQLLAKTELPPVAFETLAKLVVEINAAHHWSKYAISPEHNVGPTSMGIPRATLWALPADDSPLQSASIAQGLFSLEHWAMLGELNRLLNNAKTNPDILE